MNKKYETLGVIMGFNPTAKGVIGAELKAIVNVAEIIGVKRIRFITSMSRKSISAVLEGFSWPDWDVYFIGEGPLPEVDLAMYFNSTQVHAFIGGVFNPGMARYYIAMAWYTNRVLTLSKCTDSNEALTNFSIVQDRYVWERNRPEPSKFWLNPDNTQWEDMVLNARPNLKNVWFIGNGSRAIKDWVADARYKSEYPNQTFYIGDDVFFNINKEVRGPESVDGSNGKGLWIGFLKGGNIKRAKTLKKILSGIESGGSQWDLYSPHFEDKQGKKRDEEGTEALKALSNVNWSAKALKGDTEAYFKKLNEYAWFLFIGKGDSTLNYINKTVYDCYIAKVPLLVWRPADPDRVIFGDVDCYFDDAAGLQRLIERCGGLSARGEIVSKQSEKIEKWLGTNEVEEFREFIFGYTPDAGDTNTLQWIEKWIKKQNTNKLF